MNLPNFKLIPNLLFCHVVPSPPGPVLNIDSLRRNNMIFALPPEERHRKSLSSTKNLRASSFLVTLPLLDRPIIPPTNGEQSI